MTDPLVIIRPEPGASKTMALAQRQGWNVIKRPLFAVRPVSWKLSDPSMYDALIIGSANAVRHGGGGLHTLKHLPVYAVGNTTAQEAADYGFEIAHAGAGGIAELLPRIAEDGCKRLLWLSGRDHVPLPDHALTIDQTEVYSSGALPMPDDLRTALSNPAVILLHSARAATHFRAECENARIDISRLSLACFGPRVTEAAGPGWAQISTAKKHSDKALLAVAQQLCKMRPHM